MTKTNYDKYPCTHVRGCDGQAFGGYDAIAAELGRRLDGLHGRVKVLTVECYPGVRENEVLTALTERLKSELVLLADDASMEGEAITRRLRHHLTDDRVFGVMYHGELDEFFPPERLAEAKSRIEAMQSGLVLVYGVGASLIHPGDVLVYADMARWEIQQRYRSGELANWKMHNYNEDALRKFKRGYFIEWRLADRLKKRLFDRMDYLLDTNKKDDPKMVTADAMFEGMRQVLQGPFRVVPYFDPGVWGGQWMKGVCGLDEQTPNFAWSFDGVPEENSLYMQYGGIRVEMPSINLVFRHPVQLLGDKVHARFGTEFPIRFDFLDTMDGQNLSLQVHPLTEYVQDKFGMHYTQDESYYILDAREGAKVYLGVKTGTDPYEMIAALEEAQRGESSFEATRYVNEIPAKKHDHFLIPAGTVHCSGDSCMVLEISATPYIFTFKLWDWDRLGLDGRPRPVHIEHGSKNIQYDRDTEWVEKNLINRIEPLSEGDGWQEERTGLHEREFIETRRYWFQKPVPLETGGSVNVLNLVEGEAARVESPDGAFEPFEVHYAETFIIPAHVGRYTVAPVEASPAKPLGVVKASVRV